MARMSGILRALLAGLAMALSTAPAQAAGADTELLNASYDVARDVYRDLNPAFIAQYRAQAGKTVVIDQSHGGSSKQARAVIDGLEADVVTMNNPLDVDRIADAGLLPATWAGRLPNASAPSWSTILFLVRKGNPKKIRDWGDLVRPGVAVVLPNPKTSGNGRYSYLAGWEWAKRAGGSDAAGEAYVRKLFANVPVLDTGGRGATSTFVQRGIGDVLLTFENEIGLLRAELGASDYEVVVPSLTVRADNPVAVVDKVAGKHGTTALATAYLKYHYSAAAQEIFAKNYFRPVDDAVLQQHGAAFPRLEVFRVEAAFGSWPEAQKKHFADGGVFDRIYSQR